MKTIRRKKKKRHKRLLLLFSLLLIGLALKQLSDNPLFPTMKQTVPTTLTTSKKFSRIANQSLKKTSQNDQLQLLLQKDVRWFDTPYGSSGNLAENGCAILVLAMIETYWNDSPADPFTVLEWAGNDFYVPGQGTSWDIFPSFAQNFNYQLYQPNTIYDVQDAIANELPVIVSLSAGTFTTTGHFLLLYANSEGQLIVYDPNDDSTKNHYQQTFSTEIFEAEALNYWVLYR